MGGEDKQLLAGAAAALVVLAVGVVAYLYASSTDPAPDVPAATAVALRPSSARMRKPAVPQAASTADAPADGDPAQKPDRRASRLPQLNSDTNVPVVRPAYLTAAIEKDLRASEAAFQACYAAELQVRPQAKGRAVLRFSIDENSEVSSISVELRAIPSMSLKFCLEGVAQEVVFGSVDEPATVWWPLLMWPDKGLSVQSPVTK